MIFKDEQEVISLLKLNKKAPQWITEAREYHKELKQIALGEEFIGQLLQIEHVESEKKASSRRKYSRSIQDTVERLLRLIDNVYTATGGTKVYNIDSDEKRRGLLKLVTKGRDNRSLENWLRTFWSKVLYIVDPSGLVFLEYSVSRGIDPHPTYKSIDSIRNYSARGQNIEWVIFEPVKVPTPSGGMIEHIRVVDDVVDYTVIVDGDDYRISPELTFNHPFGEVPGLINSNIQKLGTNKRYSLIDVILPLLKEMLRDQSVLTIYKFQNGFPTPIRPRLICPSCNGLGKSGVKSCPDCDGEGVVLNRDVTDEIIWPVSMDKDESVSAPPAAFTFMTPPLEIWNQLVSEMARNENKASDTLWGTHKERVETQERTAFETYIDTQPVTTKLSEISEVAEFMEHQLTEWLANYNDPTKRKDETVAVVSNGKMFIIEPAEAILAKYRINKEKGVSVVILDRQFVEYITSKYKNNPVVLQQEIVKMQLDYYIHYTVKEVYDVFGVTEAKKKILFTDWWETLDHVNLDTVRIEKLKTDRDDWVGAEIARLSPNPVPAAPESINQNIEYL